MKKKQIAQLGVTLGLVAAVGIGGTFALLQAESNVVTNTFTVGDGYLKDALYIDETEVVNSVIQKDEETQAVKRTQTGSSYANIQQGDVLTKDPQVHITQDNAKSYVFVNVTGLQALIDAGVAVNWDSDQWVKVDARDVTADTNYYYSLDGENPAIVDPTNAQWDSDKLFTTLDLENADLYDEAGEPININNIVIKACAVQATTTQNGVETNVDFNDALELVTFAE